MGDPIRIVLLTLALAAWPITAQSADDDTFDARTEAARAVVSAHLEAIGKDDAVAAFGYLAPNVKSHFPTPDIFLEYVREVFAPVYHVRYVEFRDSFETGNNIVVPVYVINDDNLTALAIYGLIRQPGGTWLISTCNLSSAPPLAEPPT